MAPPEINSGRMYCGPGSASMVEAAVAWDGQAACLNREVAQWRAVTSKLTTAAVEAAVPYISWLDAAATGAAHAAVQAAAAACAHELARAAMVPPEMINANRAKLASLATTNCLAQTSAMIADTDAEYEKMWAEDADAMYAYARASADASALTPFGSPPHATDPAALARHHTGASRPSRALESASDVLSTGQQVMAAIPKALQGLLSSPQTSLDDYLSSVTASLSQLSSLSERPEGAISNLNYLNRAAVLQKTVTLMSSSSKTAAADGAASAAGFGLGRSIGTLSVPQRWVTEATNDPDSVELWRGCVREPIHLVLPPQRSFLHKPISPRSQL
jgi:PPE-repeat protein